MIRILFVDDDAMVLASLRRVLRRDSARWHMEFALGSDAATAALAANHFDVVVTDMRMPGVDGSGLLRTVMERYPNTVRLMLSGSADTSDVVRAQEVAHELLGKPCGSDVLRSTIERWLAASLRNAGGVAADSEM